MTGVAARSSDRILQRALDLFSTKGYDSTSVREICAAAGITKPTLYHFYGSKEGLYRALVDGALEGFHEELERRLASGATVEERLKQVAQGYFEAGKERSNLMRFIFGLVYGPPSSAPVTDFHRFYDDMVARIAQAVDEGVARSELSPGPTSVRMLVLMGALGEALTGYLLFGHPEPTADLADTIVESILTGWRRHP